MEVVMKARTDTIAEMVEDCATGRLPFGELCAKVAAMGYKTTSLYEMVCAVEAECNGGQPCTATITRS